MEWFILAILSFFNIFIILAAFKMRNTFLGIISGIFFIVFGFLLISDGAITFTACGSYGVFNPVLNETEAGVVCDVATFEDLIVNFIAFYLVMLGMGSFILSIVYGVRGSKEEEDLDR